MNLPPEYRPPPALPPRLDPQVKARPGISLVTACRDRNDNLAKALPSWLALDLAEIVVVDWTSTIPVARTLEAMSIHDPRIRILRIEGEKRWILSYAFNAGFRLARHEMILKADADIALAPDFLEQNPLATGEVVVGNWSRARPEQKYVNGFFFVNRVDLARVNGFNEYITTYGWDDDDLYDRLRDAGVTRVDVAEGTVQHLDHDDTARLCAEAKGTSGWADLRARPMFAIRTNRFLATMMPAWDIHRTMLPLGWLEEGRLARAGDSPHLAPAHLRARAEWLAAWELLSWRAGLRVFDLDESGLHRLLSCRRFEAITDLHVELVLAQVSPEKLAAPRHLVADLDLPALSARPHAAAPLKAQLDQIARETGRVPVIRATRVPRGLAGLDQLSFVPASHPLGPAARAPLGTASDDLESPVLAVPLAADDIAGLVPAAPAPVVRCPSEGRIVIDPCHGLGNRMRAIASAGAIAQATGRDLVINWRADDHCEAGLGDLFQADCAVTETDSIDEARARGDLVLDNMETGPSAAKGALLELIPGRDAYLRSAYVITHPASHWVAENTALAAVLRPRADIRALAPPGPFDIALHVRMEAAGGSFDAAHNWSAEGHEAILHWRGQSHYGRFMTRLDAWLTRWEGSKPPRIFLAADQADTRDAFAARYGTRVAMRAHDGPDPGRDRSPDALRGALADMLALSESQCLLASPWSSFGEVALRLSGRMDSYERAGLDF